MRAVYVTAIPSSSFLTGVSTCVRVHKACKHAHFIPVKHIIIAAKL